MMRNMMRISYDVNQHWVVTDGRRVVGVYNTHEAAQDACEEDAKIEWAMTERVANMYPLVSWFYERHGDGDLPACLNPRLRMLAVTVIAREFGGETTWEDALEQFAAIAAEWQSAQGNEE